MGVLVRDGFELKYVTQGQGPEMLVIGSAIYYPRVFSQHLRQHFRMTFIDHRGFAKFTGDGSAPVCDLDVILDDIEALRIHLALKDVVVVGHSGHGFMALEYAKKFSSEISKVVMLNMGPDYGEDHSRMAEQYFEESADPERKAELAKNLALLGAEIAAAPEKRFITFCLRLGARSWFDAGFDASELWRDVTVNMDIFDHIWGCVFRNIDLTKGLQFFSKPVFLGLGLYDYLVPPFYSWLPYRSQFKNLTFRIFPKSSHTPSFEEPIVFDWELLQWHVAEKAKSP